VRHERHVNPDRRSLGHERVRRPVCARPKRTAIVLLLCASTFGSLPAGVAMAAVLTHTSNAGAGVERARASEKGESSLESAAAKAGETGRAVAMSLIGLAFAVAATVLAFRRDFKEAAGVFAVGIVSVLLATPAGIALLRDTVGSLFGAG
jgi:hypothetical protein